MFSKKYRGKKVLKRFTYITPTGIVMRIRNTGAKSNKVFQNLIDNGNLDYLAKLRLFKTKGRPAHPDLYDVKGMK